MTEPGRAGSNPVWLETTARRDGNDYVIRGRKWFTSGADGAAFAIVMAVTDRGGEAPPARQPDPGADGHARLDAGAQHPAHGPRGRGLLQPRRGGDRGLPGTGGEPHRRGGLGLRAGPGAPGARPHPPRDALDRRGRARAGPAVRARRLARAASGSAAGLAPVRAARHRGEPGRDRRRPPAGVGHGRAHRGRGPGRAHAHLAHQVLRGRRAGPRAGPRAAGARRAGPDRRHRARLHVAPRARRAHLRRARRSAQVGRRRARC